MTGWTKYRRKIEKSRTVAKHTFRKKQFFVSQTSGELLLFLGYHVPGPLTKSLNTQNNRWCRMTLGHLGELNTIAHKPKFLVWSIFGILGPFALSVFLFRHPLGDVIA